MYLTQFISVCFCVLFCFDNEARIDFNIWKQNSLTICKKECNEITDEFYSKECNYIKSDIEFINVKHLDSLYLLAINKAKMENDDVKMKYFIHYFFSGEYNDVLYFFIFEKNNGKKIVMRYSDYEKKLVKSRHRKLSKKIINPKTGFGNKKGIADHSAIITEFKDFEIKSNKVIFNPRLCFYEKLIEL